MEGQDRWLDRISGLYQLYRGWLIALYLPVALRYVFDARSALRLSRAVLARIWKLLVFGVTNEPNHTSHGLQVLQVQLRMTDEIHSGISARLALLASEQASKKTFACVRWVGIVKIKPGYFGSSPGMCAGR